jgi:hypothetical protein
MLVSYELVIMYTQYSFQYIFQQSSDEFAPTPHFLTVDIEKIQTTTTTTTTTNR